MYFGTVSAFSPATTKRKRKEREKMETSAYIALSRQTALRRQMAVVANNLANMNTLRDIALTPAKGCLERFYFCGDKEKKVEMKCSNAHGTASNVSPPSCLSAA